MTNAHKCKCRECQPRLYDSAVAMRDWLADCFEDVDFDQFTYQALCRAVNDNYGGGITQFRRDA